jgi:long-chain acyl-CoA synthetase
MNIRPGIRLRNSPGEIEAVLGEHAAVHEVAVVGIPDTEWGEAVAAAVVLEPAAEATEQELHQWVRDRLRSRMPEHIRLRVRLPDNATGKLLRRVIKSELTTSFT